MFNEITEFISWVEVQKRTSPKLSLFKIKSLCDIIGNPHQNIKFVHIGGTNGKGSTVSFLKNILISAGLNVGTFISPYVTCFNERIAYNDQYISDEELLFFGNQLLSFYPEIEKQGIEKPTFFEVLTLISFLYFNSKKTLDVVILEVGLGGLLDTTNIITPLVSAITNVSFDHMNILGNSLAEIAKNKLGIAKPNVPLYTIYNEELADIFIEHTNISKSPLHFVNLTDVKDLDINLTKTSFSYKEHQNLELKLLGRHQIANSILSIELAKYLQNYFTITNEDIRTGLYNTTWPGRLEVISQEPLIVIDGAHNAAGISALTKFLIDLNLTKKVRIIFAVSHDKEKIAMIHQLEQVVDEIIFTKFDYKRSNDAHTLYELSTHPHKRIEENIQNIIEEIFNKDDDKINLFCGSLYFVSEVRQILKEKLG